MLRRVTDLYFLKMPVNAVQYRVTVGIFNNRKLIINLRFELPSCSKLSNNLSNFDPNYISLLSYIFLIAFLFSKGYDLKISTKLHISIFLFNILLGVLVWLYSCLIILRCDVEVNPGPKNSVSECLSICHWNLNSISAHDYSKLFLLKAYISVHKFDIICLSETYLDSTVALDDDNLEVWHCKEANADLIKRAINNFNWEKAFSNTNINEKVSLFNKTILNILNNYIPHETIICDDKDPPWFNSRIKSLIENKNKIHKNYQRYRSNSQLLSKPNLLQEKLHLLINRSKRNYYSRMASKLTNVQRNSKTYWSLLNHF